MAPAGGSTHQVLACRPLWPSRGGSVGLQGTALIDRGCCLVLAAGGAGVEERRGLG